MARRYGNKNKVDRKWKKITNMNKDELLAFKKSLENDNQFTSDVYQVVKTHLSSRYLVV